MVLEFVPVELKPGNHNNNHNHNHNHSHSGWTRPFVNLITYICLSVHQSACLLVHESVRLLGRELQTNLTLVHNVSRLQVNRE